MATFGWIALVLATALVALHVWRSMDERRTERTWRSLATRTPAGDEALFDPALLAALPEPVRRYFLFTIAPGTPVRRAAVINTVGEIGLGTRARPNYVPMRAQQVLAPPHGLVWKLKAGRGLLRITGSDGFDGRTSWVRLWLLGTVPIVRAGGSADHARAAFGRVVAEAVFWTPAALLPGDHVRWEAAGENVARAIVSHGGMVQSVDVTVAEDGRPTMVVIPRWSNANPEGRYRVQPFGGYLSDFRKFGGYRLPTRVEGGNFINTDDYFAFYKVRVEDLRFIFDARQESLGVRV